MIENTHFSKTSFDVHKLSFSIKMKLHSKTDWEQIFLSYKPIGTHFYYNDEFLRSVPKSKNTEDDEEKLF